MRHLIIITLILSSLHSLASGLPNWAKDAVTASPNASMPANATVVTLLDETLLELKGNGQWLKNRRIIKRVLKSEGIWNASVYRIDGKEGNTQIKRLKGWHLTRRGKVQKLEKEHVVSAGQSFFGSDDVTRDMQTAAFFDNVHRGSIVAFESQELLESYFSLEPISLLTSNPVLQRRIKLKASRTGDVMVFRTHNLEKWGIEAKREGSTLHIAKLPVFKDESLSYIRLQDEPLVQVGFFKDGVTDPLKNWDAMARWYGAMFQEKSLAGARPQQQAAADSQKLLEAVQKLNQDLVYQQRYLDVNRGYEPLSGAQVADYGYGDCKDMVSYLNYQLSQEGIAVIPVLTTIVSPDNVSEDLPAGPFFNHLIAAIPLSKSLGYASEVKAGDQLYLIYDPTDHYTPLGKLSGTHRGRNMLLATSGGAHFVTVPDAAIEERGYNVALRGLVDANFTMKGRLTVQIPGDAAGLRTQLQENNRADLFRRLHYQLDLPHYASLRDGRVHVNERGELIAECDIHWPVFFKRDLDGLRLSEAITGDFPIALDTGETRQNPIMIRSVTPIQWDLSLDMATKLGPGQEAFESRGDLHTLSWKVTAGDSLQIQVKRSRAFQYFDLSQLDEGLKIWASYRDTYLQFLMDAAMFKE